MSSGWHPLNESILFLMALPHRPCALRLGYYRLLHTQSRLSVRTPTHCEPAEHARADNASTPSEIGSAFQATSTSATGSTGPPGFGGCPGPGGGGGGTAARADFTAVHSFVKAASTSLGRLMFEPVTDSTVGSRDRLKYLRRRRQLDILNLKALRVIYEL